MHVTPGREQTRTGGDDTLLPPPRGLRGEGRVGEGRGVSECWMFYTIPTSRVIFTAKPSLDLFGFGLKQVFGLG